MAHHQLLPGDINARDHHFHKNSEQSQAVGQGGPTWRSQPQTSPTVSLNPQAHFLHLHDARAAAAPLRSISDNMKTVPVMVTKIEPQILWQVAARDPQSFPGSNLICEETEHYVPGLPHS